LLTALVKSRLPRFVYFACRSQMKMAAHPFPLASAGSCAAPW